ncbi:MAG: hypothetical protein WCO37_08980, partial [Bacteroidota bacterium]
MKKLILLFLVLVLKFSPAKAQWVTIPDTAFVNKLTQLYPSCMNGNLMDTTCAGIVSEDSLIVSSSNISNLFGVQFFDNLSILNCYNNILYSLPALPSTLSYLDCSITQLNSLPALPSSLDSLYCRENHLSSLSILPSSLKYLDCYGNDLSSLPVLPSSLTYLNCQYNQLTSLPSFPSTLTFLNCAYNQLSSLPTLPNSLEKLWCSYNQLSSMPALPSSLTNIICNSNQLSSLPTLPSYLTYFNCKYNQLTSLPSFPSTLTYLDCSYNQLSSLPALPNSLEELYCHYNQMISMPSLPSSLLNLQCNNNQLSSLPEFPITLTALFCYNNQLSSLPSFPSVMSFFRIENNNILCLNNLPQISNGNNSNYVNISGNPLTCVPNQTAYSLNLPFCIEFDAINNPNNCISNVNISGNVYTDQNNNCTYNAADLESANIPVKLFNSNDSLIAQTYTNVGTYGFKVNTAGAYKVKIDSDNLPIEMACALADSQTVNLVVPTIGVININFPVVCDSSNYYDANVQSVSRIGWIFPGQTHTLKTNVSDNVNWFNLDCTNDVFSGTVTINVYGPVSYISPAVGALIPVVSGNTFVYTVPDFNALNPNSFNLLFQTNTTAQANDQICVHVEISPNPIDADTTNNVYDFCYNVVNSYDPNMKEVYPVNVLPGYDDWFTYTIHFQNTGNAPAFNIRLRDTLDTQLDLNTFEVLGYSHPATIGVSGNILTVRFNNIMLPDSTSDYEGSMGYFQYRIKPLPNLPNGSQISNTAYIYFDFNAPIITNTTANNFEFPVKLSSIVSSENSFSLYPNPSTGIFTFKDAKAIQ